MSVRRAWQILRKDLRMGPRSPIFLWALVIPIALTLLVRGVLGGLFDDAPSLGVVDEGTSTVSTALEDIEGLDVRRLEDRADLLAEVADGRLDGGLVLPTGFDRAVRAGERPPLLLWVAGESLPADRAVLTVAVLDLVRGLAGHEAVVDVEIVEIGEAGLPLDLRLLPLLVLFAVAVPGAMVPAASLVEEKERGTLHAVLASPVTAVEVLLAKGTLGVLLGILAGTVTLALNDAFGASPTAVLAAVLLGAVMMAQIGLLLGSWARDTNMLFTAWKAGALLLFLPAFFFVWPDLPTWPAQLVPTYYFLAPAYAVGVDGASLGEVAGDLLVGAVICALLVPVVALAAGRMERRLATGPAPRKPTPAPVG